MVVTVPVVAPTSTDGLSADWATSVAAGLNAVAAGRRPVAAGRVLVKLTDRVSASIGKYYRGHARVDFPDGLFQDGPVVALAGHSGYPGTVIQCSFNGISHTGMTVVIARSDTTATYVNWIATLSDSSANSAAS